MQKVPAWVRPTWHVVLIIFTCIGTVIFFSKDELSLYPFVPSAFVGGVLIIFEIVVRLPAVLLAYEISTWVSFIAIAVSFVLFVLGLKETDPGRQCAYLGFGGSAFSFGTGIPIGKVVRRRSA